MFDRFAGGISRIISKGWFFGLCLGLVAAWLALGPVMGWGNSLYHLLLNSPTTATTFLMVAVLQNATERFEDATRKSLRAMAQALAHLMVEREMDEYAAELRRVMRIQEEALPDDESGQTSVSSSP